MSAEKQTDATAVQRVARRQRAIIELRDSLPIHETIYGSVHIDEDQLPPDDLAFLREAANARVERGQDRVIASEGANSGDRVGRGVTRFTVLPLSKNE